MKRKTLSFEARALLCILCGICFLGHGIVNFFDDNFICILLDAIFSLGSIITLCCILFFKKEMSDERSDSHMYTSMAIGFLCVLVTIMIVSFLDVFGIYIMLTQIEPFLLAIAGISGGSIFLALEKYGD